MDMTFLESNNVFDYDYSEEGKTKPVLLSQDAAKKPLSSKLQSLWSDQERPFLTLTEQNVSVRPPTNEEQAKPPGHLDETEVKKLKEAMFEKLNLANNELHLALDLINLLVPVPATDTQPELPLHQTALAASVLSTPLPPYNPPTQAHSASQAYASKLHSLEGASKSLLAASKRMKTVSARSKDDWKSYVHWRDEGYEVQARGAARGASLNGKGAERLAKEMVVLTTCQECMNVGLRSIGLGWLAEGSDEGKRKIAFPERRNGRRRLRVGIKKDKEESWYTPKVPADDLKAARLEMLDEDIYDLALREIRQTPKIAEKPMESSVEENSLTLTIGKQHYLTLEMTSIEDLASDSSSSKDCDLAASTLYLRILSIYQARCKTSHSLGKAPANPPILRPIVDLLAYRRMLSDTMPSFHLLIKQMKETLSDQVLLELDQAMEGSAGLLDQLFGSLKEKITLGGSVRIRVNGIPRIEAFFSSPREVAMLMPHGRVVATSVAQLKDMLLMQMRSIQGFEQAEVDWDALA